MLTFMLILSAIPYVFFAVLFGYVTLDALGVV